MSLSKSCFGLLREHPAFRRPRLVPTILLAMLAWGWLAPATWGEDNYAPPEATFTSASQLQAWRVELEQGNFTEAAHRLDALLRDSRDALLREDDALLSVAAWVSAGLPDLQRQGLAKECELQFAATAERAIDNLVAQPSASPGEFYALWRRYPLTGAGAAALAGAGRRSLQLGDLDGAQTLFILASRHGWQLDAEAKRLVETSDKPRPGAYLGRAPFPAAWFNNPQAVAWFKFLPVAGEGIVYVPAAEGMVALRETGTVAWRWAEEDQQGQDPGRRRAVGHAAPRQIASGVRGPALAAGAWADPRGVPQILVSRQRHPEGGWQLRAHRAADGKALWQTASRDDHRGLTYAGNPLVAGRFAYGVALEAGVSSDKLVLVASELTTGRQAWRCDLGTVSRANLARGARNVVNETTEVWPNQGAPTVWEDQVLVTPGVGWVISVGRFDGKLRWARPYRPQEPEAPRHRPRDARAAQQEIERVRREARRPRVPRWTTEPAVAGARLVVTPQDDLAVVCLELPSGKIAWKNEDLPGHTLVGAAAGVAVLAGETVVALDLATGQHRWTATFPRGASPNGPPALHGQTVFVPTVSGTIPLSLEDGSTTPLPPARPPSFLRLLNSDAARAALSASDVLGGFGMSDE